MPIAAVVACQGPLIPGSPVGTALYEAPAMSVTLNELGVISHGRANAELVVEQSMDLGVRVAGIVTAMGKQLMACSVPSSRAGVAARLASLAKVVGGALAAEVVITFVDAHAPVLARVRVARAKNLGLTVGAGEAWGALACVVQPFRLILVIGLMQPQGAPLIFGARSPILAR